MEDEEVRLTALDKPARRGRSPALFFTQEELKMCMDDYEFFNQKKVNKDRERNEANDAAVYARKGIEAARTCIPEDTAEYVILAVYPGENDFEVLGVGTKKFGLEMGLKMDCDVTLSFV
jgi:hypothetical protein